MKVVILAGGFGTRISEESHLKPKPMINIGDKPILWHIMKIYSYYGFNDFVICCGYKGHLIKEYFSNYYLYESNITFDLRNNNAMETHECQVEPWKVTLVNTGLHTMTGGRIKRISSYVNDEPFLLTYGDGLCDVDISELVRFHFRHGKIVTLTAVKPEARFGYLDLNDNKISSFREKNFIDGGWINGGFMVLNPEIFEYIDDDETIFEKKPLERMSEMEEMMAYKHFGFWQSMDTQRDKKKLEKLWLDGNPIWKKWD